MPRVTDDKIVFRGVPKGQDVRLVALKVEDESAYFASKDFSLGAESVDGLVYEEAGVEEIKDFFTGI